MKNKNINKSEYNGFPEEIVKSSQITGAIKTKKDSYISSISREQVNIETKKIMDKVSSKDTGFKHLILKRFVMATGSIAAVFLVFFFINGIFGVFDNNLDLFPLNGKNDQKSVSNDWGNFDMISEGAQEAILSPTDQLNTEERTGSSQKDFEADGPAAEKIELHSYFKTDYIELSEIILKNTLYFYEGSNEKYSYIGVFAYENKSANDLYDEVKDIFSKNNISADIKIITGEKDEKLVEYTGGEFLQKIVSDDFTGERDYIIILIDR